MEAAQSIKRLKFNMLRFIKNIFSPEELELENGKVIQPPKSLVPYILIILAIFIYISVQVTGFKFSTITRRGYQFFVILKAMFPPDWSYASTVSGPLLDTIKMSLLGSFVGSVLAVPFAVISASNVNTNSITRNVIRFILSILRTLPTLIIALIATYIFGIGTFAGTLAIGIFTFAIVAKMLFEQIETVDMGPFEAMESLGATKVQAFIASIIPQLLPTYLSICLYSFEINVRYAAILGYVGAGGIGLLLDEKLGWREYSKAGMVLFMLFITVVLIESLSRYFRKRLT
jgi:phosphonate transport system permease protein